MHKFKPLVILLSGIILLSACNTTRKSAGTTVYTPSRGNDAGSKPVSGKAQAGAKTFIQPVKINRSAFIGYAKTLLGTRYTWGSAVPSKGLDCSGFVFNVFQHFNVSCPRVTSDYTYEGREVERRNAQPGDLVLFTGSDHASGIVGHMGIITEKNGEDIMFIHSASGKRVGVILNKLTGYYENHFVKIISVLE